MHNSIVTEESDIKMKGKFITCKLCDKKFKFISSEAKLAWKEVNYICPFCKEEYCVLPETERILRKIQDLYFTENRDDKYMTQMFYILVDYSKSLIKKMFGSKRSFPAGQLDTIATDSVSLLIEKYTDPNFEIQTSFAGFLVFKIKEAMFQKKDHSCAPETIHYKFTDGNYTDVEDFQKRELDDFLEEEDKKFIVDSIYNIIEVLEGKCSSKGENYIRLLSVLIFLERGESDFSKFFKIFPRHYGKYISQRTLDIIRMELLHLYGEKHFYQIQENVLEEADRVTLY